MNRYDIPIGGNWATAIISTVNEAKDGDEIVVNSLVQERLATGKAAKAKKDIVVTRRQARIRGVLVDGGADRFIPVRLINEPRGDMG